MPKKKKPEAGKPQVSYQQLSRLLKARSKEFTLQGLFKYGYRNKEDVSNLPANTLVVGSQNVLTNAAEQVGIRNGYQLDGPAGNQNTYGIDSSYDFNTHVNGVQNVRKWGGNLEVRYANPVTGVVTWITLLSNLSASNVVNFTDFWDATVELRNLCLFVNGGNIVYEWTGGIASYLSSTATTLTVSGTKSLTNLNFYNQTASAGKMKLLINGTTYTYTGAGNTAATPFSQSPTTNKIACTPTQWSSQLFTTGASATAITAISFRANAATGPNYASTTFTVSIYTDNAGVPGTLVGSGQVSIPAVFSAGDFTLSLSGLNIGVSGATNYHVVISGDQSSNITVYTGSTPAVGTNVSTNSGTTWAAQNGYLNVTITENDTNTTTFTGVSPTPSGINVGDAVVQAVATGTANVSGISSFPSFDLIATLQNRIWYGSFTSNTIYITKINSYSDATYSTPRLPGEGGVVTIDSPPVALKPQATTMYISSGSAGWWRAVFTLSSDLKERFDINPLQTATNQGAQSQALIGKLKNSIVFVSNEPMVNAFGPVKNIYGDPNFVNMSDPIKYDVDAYNFTGGQVYYFNYFIYITLPRMGIERLYNVVKKYWEAPQVVPFSRHYEVNGVLYAHSANTNESYQCYVAGLYNDNGNPINAIAAFPYVSQQAGEANELKSFNKHYTEGYISGNSTLSVTQNYDFGGFSGTQTRQISGSGLSPTGIIFSKITDGSLGQDTLGTQPVGAILNLGSTSTNPKFRVITTFPRTNCFEYQTVYSSNDVDQQWSLLRFGPAISAAPDLPTGQTS